MHSTIWASRSVLHATLMHLGMAGQCTMFKVTCMQLVMTRVVDSGERPKSATPPAVSDTSLRSRWQSPYHGDRLAACVTHLVRVWAVCHGRWHSLQGRQGYLLGYDANESLTWLTLQLNLETQCDSRISCPPPHVQPWTLTCYL